MASRKFVSRDECEGAMSRVGADISTIKCALIGKDLRGGLVKDVADLNGKVNQIIENNRCANEVSLKWKLAIFGAVVSSVVALIGLIVKVAGG